MSLLRLERCGHPNSYIPSNRIAQLTSPSPWPLGRGVSPTTATAMPAAAPAAPVPPTSFQTSLTTESLRTPAALFVVAGTAIAFMPRPRGGHPPPPGKRVKGGVGGSPSYLPDSYSWKAKRLPSTTKPTFISYVSQNVLPMIDFLKRNWTI